MRFQWLLVVAAGVAAALAYPIPQNHIILLPLILAAMSASALIALPTPVQRWLGTPLRVLRRSPALYWFALLIYIGCTLGWWTARFQPTYGRALTAIEYSYLLLIVWGFCYIAFYDLNAAEGMRDRLGRSPFAGVLVTLTTILALFIGFETYMRLFYITTDGYGFTAMNYHWYQNFYQRQANSLDFRDYDPNPDAQTRIAVVGDSFAVGHGINNIDRTFPQLLEQRLGPGYDVNLVAQSGIDSNVMRSYVENYPYKPNVVIYSYYLNDIDYLMTDPEINPDSNFEFPSNKTMSWVVLNFFVPNYLYYNLLQFTSPERTGNHALDLVEAHTTPKLWEPHAEVLGEFVTWSRSKDIEMVVLLWPHIGAVDLSQPAIEQLTTFFEARGVPVVDMSSLLEGQSIARMTVNRFDAHPSVAANRLAADALYDVLTSTELLVGRDS